jgi:hypothetical protein
MRPSGEEEYQRFLGFPTSLWSQWHARSRSSPEASDSGANSRGLMSHPITWLRWRRELRRHGPFAPDFDDFRRRGPDTG